MGVLHFIMKRKILVGLVTILVLMVGSFGMMKLDKELLPSLDFDGAYVGIITGNQSAIEVERNITIPLERKVRAIDGVKDVNTTTTIGRSIMNVTFERGRGDELFKEMESVVNSSASEMKGINEVVIGQYGTNQAYELFMDLSGGNMKEMADFGVNVLEPRLESLNEVSDVTLIGIQKNEVSIKFNRDRIVENGLDISQVIMAIQKANTEETIGVLKGEKDTPSLRWNTKLESLEDIEEIMVPSPSGYISLKEIANVSIEPLDEPSYVWKNGSKDFILIQVGRVSNVTQIEMAEAVRKEIQNMKNEGLIDGFEINDIVAQADYVQDSINGVTDNIMIGAIIAIAIMMLFLRNIRATFVVGLSIPTSILLTFISMWVFGYSINMLTLIGLGLGVGMMVDSSIVILESIYSKKEQGLTSLNAVMEGTKEVATAVIASMLTTIVVFLPIGLVGGEMGQFMIVLSAVITITLISSVVVSFTLIPSLSEKFLKLRKKNSNKQSSMLRFYSNLVAWTVRKKRNSVAVIAIFFLMFGTSLFLITKIPMTVMPDVYNRYTELIVSLEAGTSSQEKAELVEKINESLQAIDDVQTNYIIDNGGKLSMIINMTKGKKITKPQKEVNEEILTSLRDLKDSSSLQSVSSAMSGGSGYPVQINIKGESFSKLQSIADDFIADLAKIDGIVGITNSIERTSIEEVIDLKENEIKKAGLTINQMKQLIEMAFLQMPVGEATIEGETHPISVKWDKKIDNTKEFYALEVPTLGGERKLSDFVELRSVNTPNQINHVNGERFISISADIKGRDLGSINREVQNLIESFKVPAGYTLSITGDLEQQQELLQQMLLVLGIAIFLVYLVMAVQFNSLIHPIIVMSVIPMTMIGVILGLFITQQELNMMSGMGIVMLIGIVLNNAILLIDRTNQLRKEGLQVEEALVEAGKNRIRPIFMTTLTTVGGMLPLALASGTSGSYQAPMATAIISGLLFATFITLLLIPSVYRLFTSFGVWVSMIIHNKIRKKKARNKKENLELEFNQ